VRALQMAEVRDLLSKQGATAQPESRAQFVAFMITERARIAHLGKQSNIKLD